MFVYAYAWVYLLSYEFLEHVIHCHCQSSCGISLFSTVLGRTHTRTLAHTHKKKHRCCSKSRKKKNKTNSIAHISSVLSAQLNQSNSETWSTFQRQFLSSLSNVRPQTNQINCWPNCVAGCSRVQSNYRAAYTNVLYQGMFAFLR